MVATVRETKGSTRTEVVHVRLTPAERDALRLIAERRDLHEVQAVRHLIREASGKSEA